MSPARALCNQITGRGGTGPVSTGAMKPFATARSRGNRDRAGVAVVCPRNRDRKVGGERPESGASVRRGTGTHENSSQYGGQCSAAIGGRPAQARPGGDATLITLVVRRTGAAANTRRAVAEKLQSGSSRLSWSRTDRCGRRRGRRLCGQGRARRPHAFSTSPRCCTGGCKDLPFDVVEDFVPSPARPPDQLFASPSLAVPRQQLIAYAKDNPGKLSAERRDRLAHHPARHAQVAAGSTSPTCLCGTAA